MGLGLGVPGTGDRGDVRHDEGSVGARAEGGAEGTRVRSAAGIPQAAGRQQHDGLRCFRDDYDVSAYDMVVVASLSPSGNS